MNKPNTIKIDEVEYVRADQLAPNAPPPMQPSTGHPYARLLGKEVLVRTATYFMHGRLDAVYAEELLLIGTSTVFNLGNQANLATAKWAEAEAHPGTGVCIISRSAIIDVCPIGK